jgi:hypothetical protein
MRSRWYLKKPFVAAHNFQTDPHVGKVGKTTEETRRLKIVLCSKHRDGGERDLMIALRLSCKLSLSFSCDLDQLQWGKLKQMGPVMMDLAVYMQIKQRPQSANHGDHRDARPTNISEHAESGK